MDSGFKALICGKDLQDKEHLCPDSDQDRQKVSTQSMQTWSHCRLAAVGLTVLAAILLITDISLGVHYNNLRDSHLTLEDTDRISMELIELQHTYETAIKAMRNYTVQLDSEIIYQTETNWEFEHQTRRNTDYKGQLGQIKKDIASLDLQFTMIESGCRLCPTGWILMNSKCYYFALSDTVTSRTWREARDFCRLYGGDLAVIDSKDKENSIVQFLRSNQNPGHTAAIWIGLKKFSNDGHWKWVDETALVEGYWMDDEPNNAASRDNCAGVFPKDNFFKAWIDYLCTVKTKWICEKAPKAMR